MVPYFFIPEIGPFILFVHLFSGCSLKSENRALKRYGECIGHDDLHCNLIWANYHTLSSSLDLCIKNKGASPIERTGKRKTDILWSGLCPQNHIMATKKINRSNFRPKYGVYVLSVLLISRKNSHSEIGKIRTKNQNDFG
jgi:hypothetical protein